MSQPAVILYAAMSRDGFVADAEGGVGWLDAFDKVEGPDPYGYLAFYDSVDGLLMGRDTFDQVLTFGDWIYPGKPCWVASHRELPDGVPEEIAHCAGSVDEVLAPIAEAGIRQLWLVGGGDLNRQFHDASRIDKLILFEMPVELGEGIPLFGGGGQSLDALPVFGRFWPNGVIERHYLLSRV